MLQTRARVLSVTGIALLLMAFVISCGSSSALSKSASGTGPFDIAGLVFHDLNENGSFDYPDDHGVPGIHVTFFDYGTQPYTQYTGVTDVIGAYRITGIPDDHTGRLQPTDFASDYDTYAPQPFEITVDDDSQSYPYMGVNWSGYTD